MSPSDAELKTSRVDFRPKERFSSRADAYARYRPSYPQAVIDSQIRKFPASSAVLSVADIGSGTGIFSRLLLEKGFKVYAVEPNAPMRERAEEMLSSYPDFHSVSGEAVHTTLADHSVDIVVAAQAFHWFAAPGAIREFRRILKDSGLVHLIWNDRRTGIDKFHVEYESLLVRYCPSYEEVNHRNVTLQTICDLFPGWQISVEHFENDQRVDFDGLKGRLESSSYCPTPDHPNYEPLMDQLREMFKKHSQAGGVTIRQDCVAYFVVLTR